MDRGCPRRPGLSPPSSLSLLPNKRLQLARRVPADDSAARVATRASRDHLVLLVLPIWLFYFIIIIIVVVKHPRRPFGSSEQPALARHERPTNPTLAALHHQVRKNKTHMCDKTRDFSFLLLLPLAYLGFITCKRDKGILNKL